MRYLITLLVLSSIFVSCSNNKQVKQEEKKPVEKVKAVCIWDGIAVRAEPNKDGKYLTKISLGEKTIFLGEVVVDSLDKNREYAKIELSDGTIGWTTASLIILDAEPAAIIEETPLYERPDLLNETKKSFSKVEVVAIEDVKGEWIKVIGSKKAKKGWIMADKVSKNEEDVAVAILAEKKEVLVKGELQVEKLQEFVENLPYKSSAFNDYFNDIIVKTMESEATEEIEEVVAEDTL